MKILKLSALTLATLLSSAAMANVVTNTADSVVGGAKTLFKTATNPAAVSLELGTQGYGANLAWGVNESVELQAGWTGLDLSADADIGGDDSIINWKKVLGNEYKDFEGNLKLKVKSSNPYIGVQVRPFSNWLTVGTGVIVPDQKITATATALTADEITVNDTTFNVPAGQSVTVELENRNALAPYATLGFRPNINNRFGLFAEIGAAYQGKYDVNVTASQDITDNTSGKKLVDELESELKSDNVAWYPIAKAGLTYRF